MWKVFVLASCVCCGSSTVDVLFGGTGGCVDDIDSPSFAKGSTVA